MDFRENQKGKLNKSKIGEEIRWEVKVNKLKGNNMRIYSKVRKSQK